MMRLFILIPLLVGILIPGISQHGSDRFIMDGNDNPEKWLLANLAYLDTHGIPENDTLYIPTFFHLICRANGTGYDMTDMSKGLCTLNNHFAPYGIQFYLSPHPVYGLVDTSIKSNAFYNIAGFPPPTFQLEPYKHPNALNIFVAGSVSNGGYFTSNSKIFMLDHNSIDSELGGTFAGLFFSLLPTNWNWGNCFNASYSSWPCAPATKELVDGSNCSTAGDFICDTPPDYGFSYCINDCAYNGGAKDGNCVLVDPMENNFMGFYSGCSDFVFTPQQADVMRAAILSPQLDNLDNNFVPNTFAFAVSDDFLKSPIEGDTVLHTPVVSLEWDSIVGAEFYTVEISLFPGYTLGTNTQSFITSGNSLQLPNLLPGKKYYWRVHPANAYVACTEPKASSFFTAPVSGTALYQGTKTSWSVFPNPATSEGVVRIELVSDKYQSADVRITDGMGRAVYLQHANALVSGENGLEIPVSNWAKGIYFIQLTLETGTEVKRLVIE